MIRINFLGEENLSSRMFISCFQGNREEGQSVPFALANFFFFLMNGLFYLFIFILFFCFIGPHPQHMKVPRLGVKSELQLLAYTTATAMWDPCCIFSLYHSSWQHQILNLLSEARDRTPIFMDTSQVHNH